MSAIAENPPFGSEQPKLTKSRAGTKPFAAFEWMLALRYLRPHRKESFISVIALFSFLGIMLGVATLIIVMSVMNGFRKELFDKILGLNGHIVVQAYGEDFPDYSEVTDRMRTVPGVKQVFPIVMGQVLMSTPIASNGIAVRGIRESDLKELEGVSSRIRFGTLDGFDKSGGIAVGIRLANALNVQLGDEVTIVTPRGSSTPFGTAPRVKRYPITAIFEIGMSELDANIAFLPLAESQRFFNIPDSVHLLEVLIDDPDSVDEIRPQLSAVAGKTLLFTDWRKRNATFYNALKVERNVLFIILAFIVLVAALNIVSGLIMLVRSKGPDIGILRTMGASRGTIMRVFFITGTSIGVVGTLAGFLLGLVFAIYIEEIRQGLSYLLGTQIFPSDIYFLSRMRAEVNPNEVAAVVGMSLSLSILATLYPSWRAAKLDPVEALRYE